MIPIFSNTWDSQELDAIGRVAQSRWLGMGAECQALEFELARHLGVDSLLLLNNATAGLSLSLRALGLQPRREVIIPTVHFVGAANAIVECGAWPVFADVDPHTLNLLPSEIDRLWSKRTWGVMMLHYGGHAADIDALLDAANGLTVVEDAANGICTTYHGRAIGTLADAGVWSFDSMKVMVMGDGGALWLHDNEAHDKAALMRNHGMNVFSGTDNMKQADRWWEFTVEEPSGRFVSNDILAAVGRVQLRKLAGFVARRREIWQTYQQELVDVGDIVLPPEPAEGTTATYYLYWIQTDRRDELARYLVDHGTYCTFRYHLLHRAFRQIYHLPNAEQVAERTLCLPLHQNLTEGDVGQIVETVRKFYRG